MRNLRKVLENWDIESSLPIGDVYIMDGVKESGSVWTVGADYILKTSDREKIMKNLKVAKALSIRGFTSSLPVPTKMGAEFLDGKESFILSHSLKGSPLPKPDRFGSSRIDFGKKYGKNIAQLHKALREVQSEILPDEINLYKNITEWVLPNVRRQNVQWSMGLDEVFFTDYIDTFGKLFDRLPKQLIHRDPNPDNLFLQDDRITAFLHFDMARVLPRIFDLSYAATALLSVTHGRIPQAEQLFIPTAHAIWQGYDAVSPLTAPERAALPDMVVAIQLICVAAFSGSGTLAVLAETNQSMLRFILSQMDQLTSFI